MTEAPLTTAQKQDFRTTDDKKKNVLRALNQARSMELQAIQQYMEQHYTLSDRDYGAFAGAVKRIAIAEMRHAENFAERIKELEGEPVTTPAGKTITTQEVRDVFSYDDNLETDTIRRYNEFLKICRDNDDNISARLFEDILQEEQEHLNYFQDIADHIDTLGNSYLSNIAGTSSSAGLDDPSSAGGK